MFGLVEEPSFGSAWHAWAQIYKDAAMQHSPGRAVACEVFASEFELENPFQAAAAPIIRQQLQQIVAVGMGQRQILEKPPSVRQV